MILLIKDKGAMDLFLVTSVISPDESSLWDSGIRTCMSPQERFYQTINTIQSIRKGAPSAYIVLIEGTKQQLSDEALAMLAPDYFFKTDSPLALTDINSFYKVRGEPRQILDYLYSTHFNNICSSVKRIFKLSGRYELTSKFDLSQFDDKKITTLALPSYARCVITVLYSVPISLVDYYVERLLNAVSCTAKILEEVLFEPWNQPDIYHFVTVLGARGRRAYNNELWER